MAARPIVLAAFVGVVVIAGLNFVAVRFSNRELPPFAGAALRFGGAALLFWAFVVWRKIPLPRGRGLVGALVFGLLSFAASYALAYYGLVFVPAAFASVIIALVPLLTLVLAGIQGVERATVRAGVGALVALAGIAILFWDSLRADSSVLPLLALVLAAVAIAQSSIVVKRFPRAHPAGTNAIAMTFGAVLLAALSLAVREPWALPRAPPTLIALGYLVTIGSVGLFGLYLFVLGEWTASAVSYQTVLSPFVTVAAGALLAGEVVGWAFALGGAIVLAGVYLGALRPAATRA